MPENEVLKLSSAVNLINALKASTAQALLATGITEWSFNVGVKPAITGVDDTRGAYFTSEGLLQQIIEDSGAWVDAGDPIITERYFQTAAVFNGILGVATKALLDADTSQADGTLRRVTNDSTNTNNGVYRWDDSGGSWVKEIGLGVSVLDPDDETDLLYGKAVGDFIYDTESRIKEMVSANAYDLSNLVLSENNNIESADLVWHDGVAGSISNAQEDVEGRLTSLRFNRQAGKYIILTIDYSGQLPEGSLTATGY